MTEAQTVLAILYVSGTIGSAVMLISRYADGKSQGWEVGIAPIWPLWLLVLTFVWLARSAYALNPWSEDAQLERRIRVLQNQARLLDKRQKVEAAEAQYRAIFDKMIDDTQRLS